MDNFGYLHVTVTHLHTSNPWLRSTWTKPITQVSERVAHVFYEGLRQNVKPMDGIDHVLFPSNPATADNVVLYIFVVLFALWTACSIICVVMLLFINCCQKSNNIFYVLFILFQLITLLNKPKSDQPNREISC